MMNPLKRLFLRRLFLIIRAMNRGALKNMSNLGCLVRINPNHDAETRFLDSSTPNSDTESRFLGANTHSEAVVLLY